MSKPNASDELVIATSRKWLEQAVIGLNLCPFAKKPYYKQQLRFCVCHANHLDHFLDQLEQEIQLLLHTPAEELETTLFIEPVLFQSFDEFLNIVELSEQILVENQAIGIIQIAPFHPKFQFADTDADDISNYTNRSPYPTLHLIRESSIDQAVAAFPDAAQIYQRNIALLQQMGINGWEKLGITYPDNEQS